MKKNVLITTIMFILAVNANAQFNKLDFALSIKKNFQYTFVDALIPSSGNGNKNILPTLSIGLKDSSILGHIKIYVGFLYQDISLSGKFKYTDKSIPESGEGELKFALGYYCPIIGGKFYLTNKNTRPYINAHYRLYIPNLKTDGELTIADYTYSWNSKKDLAILFNDIIIISNKEIGFGVEHKFNPNLSIFGELNFQFFKFTVKVKDAADYVDEISTAINNLENGGFETYIDVDELQLIEGNAKGQLRFISSYPSLGISFSF